jgi:hypothetical protein
LLSAIRCIPAQLFISALSARTKISGVRRRCTTSTSPFETVHNPKIDACSHYAAYPPRRRHAFELQNVCEQLRVSALPLSSFVDERVCASQCVDVVREWITSTCEAFAASLSVTLSTHTDTQCFSHFQRESRSTKSILCVNVRFGASAMPICAAIRRRSLTRRTAHCPYRG